MRRLLTTTSTTLREREQSRCSLITWPSRKQDDTPSAAGLLCDRDAGVGELLRCQDTAVEHPRDCCDRYCSRSTLKSAIHPLMHFPITASRSLLRSSWPSSTLAMTKSYSRLKHRPGSFDSATTRFEIDLDTDQNASTGSAGIEYNVFVFPAGGKGADVARTTSAGYTVVGTVVVQLRRRWM